ncbi:CHAT domain-containing protein [Gautieria morchelliformis]|nr:CHAT domain-containing protein [Gautieria morchelliformis]
MAHNSDVQVFLQDKHVLTQSASKPVVAVLDRLYRTTLFRTFSDSWIKLRINFRYNQAMDIMARFEQSGGHEDLEAAISLHRQALDLSPALHPDRPSLLNGLGYALSTRFDQLGEDEDLDAAISLYRKALQLFPASHPNRSIALNNLATALWARFTHAGQDEDLEKAVSFLQEALELQPAPHPERPSSLSNLANMLLARFQQSGGDEDLEGAIYLQRQALELFPASHPHRSFSVSNLATALLTRFEQSGQHEDLEMAISFHREALELRPAPHPDRPVSLTNLATALLTRFEQSGQHHDLETAISLARQAVDLYPAPNPRRAKCLTQLGCALRARFDQSGQQEDLEAVISLHQEALELRPTPHHDRPVSLLNLADALSTRFDQSGQLQDLETAISLNRQAVEILPASHVNRAMSFSNLASFLWTRFERSGRLEDLEDAISFHREALELRAAPHPDRPVSLSNLALALSTRFEQSGLHEDLEEEISLNRQALELRAAPHPARATYLNNLASALSARYRQSGQREDLEATISLHQEALELRPASHPDRPDSLNNLALALSTRFGQSAQHQDLEAAISFHREALELRAAPHPARATLFDNLALALKTRFEQSGQLADLEAAISLGRDALELRPAPHPDRPLSFNNLATALCARFGQLGRWEDLEEAIDALSQSQNALVAGHPSACFFSGNLGVAFMAAYTHSDKAMYLQDAMDAFRAAATCETASASQRLRIAKLWATHADSRHESALDAYYIAIQLLPRLAMLGLDLPSRHRALTSGSDGLARDAAACAIRMGQYERAVELLEEGRAVFWSQAMQLRTPMSDLRDVAPELEQRLRRISLTLEQGSLRDVSRDMSDCSQKAVSMEREASHFRRLNDEWLMVIEEVRQLEGFEDFLRPRRLSTLLPAATEGPVVILNASNTGCDGLILTSSGVQHVPLVLVLADVTALVNCIQLATASGSRDPALSASIRAHVEGLEQMLPFNTLQLLRHTSESRVMARAKFGGQTDDLQTVLAVLWRSVVKPVIQSLALEKSDAPPNLWWCPTGPFSFLPIHAAGIYLKTPECISDYVVSSYTPTISSLLSDTSLPHSSSKMMVVVEPFTPGQVALPCTVDELRRIEARVPAGKLVKLESATVKEVVSHLPTTSIAHFACHGEQHPERPLDSALMLHDNPLKVSQIMQQPIPNGTLAFLSACKTATGDGNLPDEVIHLASTLLYAGFRGVVGTMWTIFDEDGPKVADAFYEYLFRDNSSSNAEDTFRPDTTQAARALHVAVAKLRAEGVSFKRWVPFIHLGR